MSGAVINPVALDGTGENHGSDVVASLAERAAQQEGHRPLTPRLVMAGRADSFAPYLLAALRQRYTIIGDVDAELSQVQRLMSAAVTFRPSRRAWVERFYKSQLSMTLRSRNAEKALATVTDPFDVIFQTHALFTINDPRTVIYIDCTHRQSAEQWPDWNPLGPTALRRWYKRERRQYRNAAHLFAFSDETRRSLIDQYGVADDHVTVVGAGLNFDHLPETRTRAADLPPTVLFVGNDFIRKGGLQLLEAFRTVAEKVPGARLLIVGTPHPIPPQPGVEVLGRVDKRDEMAALFAQADVMCLPSTFEPYGFVLLEAMAHCLPCVATRSCGIPEIIVDGVTGTMVDWADNNTTVDIPTLADTLVDLLTDRDKAARMGRAGRRRVQEHLQWPQVVERMAPVLDRPD